MTSIEQIARQYRGIRCNELLSNLVYSRLGRTL